MLSVTRTVRPSRSARSQWRDAFNTTGPLTPKCVHRRAPASRVATEPSIPHRQFDVVRHALDARARAGRDVERQGSERRRRRDDGVTEVARDREPGAIAAGLGQGLAARRQHDDVRLDSLGCGAEEESRAGARDVDDPGGRTQRRARRVELAQKRVEHVTGAIGIREELAVLLLVERHTERFEPCDRVRGSQPAKHAADDRGLATPEIPLRDGNVGDVTARTAADENLRARFGRTVEKGDRKGQG